MGSLLYDETFTVQVLEGGRWVWLHSPPYPALGHGQVTTTTDARVCVQSVDVHAARGVARRWAREHGLGEVTYRVWCRLPWKREWLEVEPTTVDAND